MDRMLLGPPLVRCLPVPESLHWMAAAGLPPLEMQLSRSTAPSLADRRPLESACRLKLYPPAIPFY